MKDATVDEAKAFAKTLMQKSYSEAIGQLMLTFEGMDLISIPSKVNINWPIASE